jgi:hypothetical protein
VEAGKNVVVKAKITNTGSQRDTYVLDSTGYDSWATLDSISERLFTISPGESKDVTFTFKAKSDAAGAQKFTIGSLSSQTNTKQTREFSVEFPAKTSSSGSLSLSLGNNTLLWVIGAVNLILIILIIIVAVRVSRR